jgi:hypothetical protein
VLARGAVEIVTETGCSYVKPKLPRGTLPWIVIARLSRVWLLAAA